MSAEEGVEVGQETVEEKEEEEEEGGAGEEGGGREDPAEGVLQLFSGIQSTFEVEQETREKIRTAVREMEQHTRGIFTVLQGIHQCPTKDLPELCVRARELFAPVRTIFETLRSIVPPNAYYRYHDHWRFVIQRLSFLTSLLVYLESGRLASRQDVAEALGICVLPEEGFHIDLDDFLMGIISVANELSRLAVNSVILGDYQRPFDISTFVSDLNAGFRLLNLKNDALRKKFDSLKYDVKKIEEVVYDISIRGLRPPHAPQD